MDVGERDLECSQTRVAKTCKVLKIVVQTAAGVYGVSLVVAALLHALSLFAPSLVQADFMGEPMGVIAFFVHGLLVFFVLCMAAKLFKDIASGAPPFTIVQANRIRGIALLFAAYTLFDMLWSPDLVTVVSCGVVTSGIENAARPFSLHLNFDMLVASALFFCLSVVFRHGVLLQRLSDDVV